MSSANKYYDSGELISKESVSRDHTIVIVFEQQRP
jgi:hypothetical protein